MVRATPHIHHHPTLDFDQLHRSNDAHIFTTSTTSDRQTSNHISGRYISWALYSFLVGFFGVICIISVISSFVRLWYTLWLQDLDVYCSEPPAWLLRFWTPAHFPLDGWVCQISRKGTGRLIFVLPPSTVIPPSTHMIRHE